MIKYIKIKKGHILLITVMILATVMTLVLSVTFQSITDTQISKLEEDSQRALAAAEAAIEASLKTGTKAVIGQGSLSNLTGFTGEANVEALTSNRFTSQGLSRDSSYTFYLGEYDSQTKTIGPSTSQNVRICFGNEASVPALDITLIKEDEITKYVVDPSSRISNAAASSGVCPSDSSFNYSYIIPAAAIGTDSKVLIVRNLYASTKIHFSAGSNFPIQGKTISSQATTQTGVSKKIVLFQSNPQIITNFFESSF